MHIIRIIIMNIFLLYSKFIIIHSSSSPKSFSIIRINSNGMMRNEEGDGLVWGCV